MRMEENLGRFSIEADAPVAYAVFSSGGVESLNITVNFE